MAAAQACPRWQAHPHLGEAGRVPPGRLRGSTALTTPPSRRLGPRTFRQCTSVASSHLVCGSDMMASDTNTLPSGSSLCRWFKNNPLYYSLSLRREIQMSYRVLRGQRVWLLPSLQPRLFPLWPRHMDHLSVTRAS